MPTFTPNVTNIQQINSTTYADTLGLQLGLDRLQAETSTQYIKRLEFAAKVRRDHPYEGALNEISIQLGFEPSAYISLPSLADLVIKVSAGGILIGNNPIIPIVTFDRDSMWKWRMLSEVVSDINSITPAILNVSDGPAFQLARQSNSFWSFAEDIVGINIQLLHDGVQVGTERFNQVVPSYTLTQDGKLSFSSEIPVGTQITYNYIVSPYDIVGSPVALIGLKDPEFASVAEDSNNTLAYQVREFIQSAMKIDRSYWTK